MVPHLEKVKEYLFDLEYEISSEDPDEGLVVITDEDKGLSNLILDCEDDILVIEQFIFMLKEDKADILRRLLQINRHLVHGALTIDDDGRVIFRNTLELENLDRNELEGTLNAISLMMAEYANEFIGFAKA
jgi:hypothetical protein